MAADQKEKDAEFAAKKAAEDAAFQQRQAQDDAKFQADKAAAEKFAADRRAEEAAAPARQKQENKGDSLLTGLIAGAAVLTGELLADRLNGVTSIATLSGPSAAGQGVISSMSREAGFKIADPASAMVAVAPQNKMNTAMDFLTPKNTSV